MLQYPENALEFLQKVDGLVTDVFAAYYETYLKDCPDSTQNFRIFCENVNYTKSDSSIHIEPKAPSVDYKSIFDEQESTVRQIIINLQIKNLDEEEFYQQFWEQLQNPILFSTDEKKIAALIQCAEMNEIPYFKLDSFPKMEDTEYNSRTQNILPQLKKMSYAISHGYEQKTQLAELFINTATSIQNSRDRLVFVAQIIGLYERRIQISTQENSKSTNEENDESVESSS